MKKGISASAMEYADCSETAAAGAKLLVVYIMGDGRSGSTATSVVLGNHPCISSNGELHRFVQFRGHPKWDNEKAEDHRFWKEVRERYEKDGASTDYEHLEDVQGEIENYHNFSRVFFGRVQAGVYSEYYAHLVGLFKAIRAVSGRDIIVDETKRPGRGYALLQCQETDVRVIHLVRDPRGVVWSQIKRAVEQKQKSPLTAAVHYSIKNLMSLLVQLRAPRGTVMRVRYEDLAREPSGELARIGQFLDLSMDPVVAKIEAGEPLQVPFLLDGNRIRCQTEITLRFDDSWRRNQRFMDRLVATLFTLPFFLLFGYWNYPYDG
jgi:hypothetical protein